ncbi:MAG TPA: SatD family protein [Baekduia sp.]|nr:SatD family protein [Baekduia sp.]
MPDNLATLIGDVVASKEQPSRARFQESLNATLDWANEQLSPLQPLAPTVGDEFQGAFATPAAAVLASLVVRLELLERTGADSRYGLGFGQVSVLDAARVPPLQDGPGWWAAREAIDTAKRLAESPRTAFVRTCFGRSATTEPTCPIEPGLDAFVICRDATVAHMNDRQRRLLCRIMLGRDNQAELAASEGVTQGAISQNLRRSGAYAVATAQRALEGRIP